MMLRLLAPEEMNLTATEVLDRLGPPLPPFDPEIAAFGARLSARLFGAPELRAFPDLSSLAFWLRPAATTALRRHLGRLEGEAEIRVPRGLVFHVAPANVELLFVYSWWLSAVTGNRAVVRVSERGGERSALLLRLLRETFDEPAFARLRAATAIISYPRDDETANRTLSQAADLRVIWGGDATIDYFRAMPVRPDALDLVFPDRRSLSLISAPAYLDLDEFGRESLVEGFFTDGFWFDQKACSSPLLLAWVGAAAESAGADFWPRLAALAERKGYHPSPAMQMAKITEAARLVLDGTAAQVTRHGETVVVAQSPPVPPRSESCGGGLFQQTVLADLDAVPALLDRRVQTLTHFGFAAAEIAALARRLNTLCPDRMVPVGQALAFSHIWDGHDLLAAMTRAIAASGISGDSRRAGAEQ